MANGKRMDETKAAMRKKRRRQRQIRQYGILAGVLLVIVLAVLLLSRGCSKSASASVYRAEIDVQDYGTIALELDASQAPITVENFVKLAKSGFYDGLTFHRVIDGFMIQGGDPNGDGTGGSDQTIRGEFQANGVENTISHMRGTISMARNTQSMDSASSQFFIVQTDSVFLDGNYAAFGHVTSGMEIVDQICKDAAGADANGVLPKEQQPVITAVRILEN